MKKAFFEYRTGVIIFETYNYRDHREESGQDARRLDETKTSDAKEAQK